MSFLGTPLKINIDPGKWCWKMSLLLGRPIFRFHVKLREGIQAILLNTQPDIKKTNLRSPKPHKLSRLSYTHKRWFKTWPCLSPNVGGNFYNYLYTPLNMSLKKHPAELRYKSFTERDIMRHKKVVGWYSLGCKHVDDMVITINPIGSMGLVYLPYIYHKHQPFIHAGKYTVRPMDPVGTPINSLY